MNVVAQAVKKALRALVSELSNGLGLEVRAVSLLSSMFAKRPESPLQIERAIAEFR